MAITKDQVRDIERQVIGSVLADPDQLADFAAIVTTDDFGFEAYGRAWGAMLKIRENGGVIDAVTVGDELAKAGHLDDWAAHDRTTRTGRVALGDVREMGNPFALASYVERLMGYSAGRQMRRIFEKQMGKAYDGGDVERVLMDTQKALAQVRTWRGAARSSTSDVSDAASAVYDRVARAAASEVSPVKSGFIDLDRLLDDGLYPPDLIIIGGRPGAGKTMLLTSIAYNVLTQSNKRVLYCSPEMSNEEIMMRLIAMDSGVAFGKMRKGQLEPDEWTSFTASVESMALQTGRLKINDLPSVKPEQIRRELKHMNGADLLLVDYLQLMKPDTRADSRYLEIGELTRSLKSIAKEFSIPVIAGAQLGRDAEDRRPTKADLRESGDIENDADAILLLWPEPSAHVVHVLLDKYRNGKAGAIDLVTRPGVAQFLTAAVGTLKLEPAPVRPSEVRKQAAGVRQQRAAERQAEIHALQMGTEDEND